MIQFGNIAVARMVATLARFVDYDATAVMHAQNLLEGNEKAGILNADIRDPDSVLRDARRVSRHA